LFSGEVIKIIKKSVENNIGYIKGYNYQEDDILRFGIYCYDDIIIIVKS
jgi:hypothetical protein